MPIGSYKRTEKHRKVTSDAMKRYFAGKRDKNETVDDNFSRACDTMTDLILARLSRKVSNGEWKKMIREMIYDNIQRHSDIYGGINFKIDIGLDEEIVKDILYMKNE